MTYFFLLGGEIFESHRRVVSVLVPADVGAGLGVPLVVAPGPRRCVHPVAEIRLPAADEQTGQALVQAAGLPLGSEERQQLVPAVAVFAGCAVSVRGYVGRDGFDRVSGGGILARRCAGWLGGGSAEGLGGSIRAPRPEIHDQHAMFGSARLRKWRSHINNNIDYTRVA
jgi:hypothetical protein